MSDCFLKLIVSFSLASSLVEVEIWFKTFPSKNHVISKHLFAFKTLDFRAFIVSPKWPTNSIAVMMFVMGVLYYCYGPHYGNGSSKYRVVGLSHELRTPNEAFFHQNHKLLNLVRQFGLINLEYLGYFRPIISTHFGSVSPLSMFSINQPLFQQKTKPLYLNPKYLFGVGIWIWIWAAKN